MVITDQPLVSVIMSAFNSSRTISTAVESILNQSFQSFEFIIVNDASSDNTLSIVESFTDSRIKLINNNENIGLTKSLNNAIKIANGKYIARQDADDISSACRLASQVDYLNNNPEIGLVGTWSTFIDDDKRSIDTWMMPTDDSSIRKILEFSNAFCHGSVMFRRSVFEQAGKYREKFLYTQDYELWLRMSEVCKLANLDESLYLMYRGKSTISRKKLAAQLSYQIVARELHKERLSQGTDRYLLLDGYNPNQWIKNHYPSSIDTLKELKNENYNLYINEAIQYKDFFGAMALSIKKIENNGILYDLKEFTNVAKIFSLYIKWLYMHYLGWRF